MLAVVAHRAGRGSFLPDYAAGDVSGPDVATQEGKYAADGLTVRNRWLAGPGKPRDPSSARLSVAQSAAKSL
jgi:hypothetical protein